jgi:hypothetical protein
VLVRYESKKQENEAKKQRIEWNSGFVLDWVHAVELKGYQSC